ncbi:MAG: lipopolysaccharide kinase InaA family protein [Planctomycetota bacterium]
MSDPAIPLKRNPRRTVFVLPASTTSPEARVVKRYHHPGPFARLLDGSRAREELRLLRELARRGVPVPRAIETRRVDGGFELVTEWIEGALSLDTLAPSADLVREAARTLARAHVAGLAHPDLHPGNLVAQPGGRTWIVDLRGARIGRGFDARTARRDLVGLASAVRERVASSVRARFLLEYARALPGEHRAKLPKLQRLAREVEFAARIHRREAVRRARKRWTRLSSVCRPITSADFDGFASLEAESDALLVVRDRSWRKLLGAWYAAARLHEHGIPCARPQVLSRAPERFATFALPPGAGASDPPASAEQLRAIEATLEDRCLGIEGTSGDLVRVDRTGRAWIGPLISACLVDFDAQDATP